MPNTNIKLMGGTNEATGIVENFVINMQEPIYGANYLFAVLRYNRGTIQNGYIYGKNIEAIYPLAEGQTRYVAIQSQTNYVKGISRNIYTLASVNVLEQEGVTNNVANIVSTIAANCKIQNIYSVGIGNRTNFNQGPNAINTVATREENCYYFSEEVFPNSYSQKASTISLWDTKFQNQVLNADGAFNVDELVSQGYYPQIIMPEVMPRQEYIPLPEVKDTDLADLTGIEIIEQTDNEATILCNIYNPSGGNVTDVKIENVSTSIVSQEYEDGVSKVIVKLTNPTRYVSKYSVMSITVQGTLGTTYTRNFEQNERFIEIEFFRQVYNVQDWKNIKQSPTENYKLMADINFINEGNDISITGTFSGKIDGNGYSIRNINITTYLFYTLTGSITNLNIENVIIKNNTAYLGIIRSIQAGSKLENVHVNQIELQNTGTATNYVGALCGTVSQTTIQNCSVRNANIKINTASNVTVGGMVGYSNYSSIINSYITNVNIEINEVSTTEGIGGIVGTLRGSSNIQNCYAQGKIKSTIMNVGGIAGTNISESNITNCYSVVNIESDVGYIGGIEGSEQKTSNTQQDSGNLALRRNI